MRKNPTLEYVKSILDYDPKTGIFRWKHDHQRFPAGTEAGSINPNGYRYICIAVSGKKPKFLAHRLAWFYMTGKWPIDEIDHRDTDNGNNKWDNLREATSSQNKCNKVPYNKTGYKGVYYHNAKRRCRWGAAICINKKRKSLGMFFTAEAAYAAYCAAVEKYHGEFARVA